MAPGEEAAGNRCGLLSQRLRRKTRARRDERVARKGRRSVLVNYHPSSFCKSLLNSLHHVVVRASGRSVARGRTGQGSFGVVVRQETAPADVSPKARAPGERSAWWGHGHGGNAGPT